MELLRRALLVGCMLPGLWLTRLAPLDPLLSLTPVDFAAQQAREAASVPDNLKTEAQRRRAEIDLSVYIEEFLQYNVFPASGTQWDRLLSDVDRAVQDDGTMPDLDWRISPDRAEDPGSSHLVFFRSDEEPMSEALDQLAAGHGTTYVSISRPGGDRHYRLERRVWTRRDFELGRGFVGRPAAPASLLYPFRWIGAVLAICGVLLFLLLPGDRRSSGWLGFSALEAGAFTAAMLLFAAPLVLVGGSVQALARGPFVVAACWILSAIGVHLFAGPWRNAPDAVRPSTAAASPEPFVLFNVRDGLLFVREGAAFLALALGPAAFLIMVSTMLWNR